MVADSTSAKAGAGRRRRKIVLTVFLSMLVMLLLLAPVLLSCYVWDGHFQLTLDVTSSSGKHISEVSYAAVSTREQAEWTETHTSGESEFAFRPTSQDNGRFIAHIPCSGRCWVFDIETSYSEFRYVVVRAKYESGKVFRRMAEVPVGRGPRTLKVLVP